MQDDYYRQVRSDIRRWEARGPSFLNAVSDTLLGPARMAVEGLIPVAVQEEVSSNLEQMMLKMQAATTRLIDPVRLQREVQILTEDLGLELMASDQVAKRCWGWNLAYAGAGGALTGLGGWAGLVMDVPALFVIAQRTLQEIATCYGYDVSSDSEQAYIHHLLTVGSCGDLEAKLALLTEVKKVELAFLKDAAVRFGADALNEHLVRTATREAAQTIGVQMIRRKSLQALPLVGALFGAATNAYLIHDLAESAFMSYRRRRLTELDASLVSS